MLKIVQLALEGVNVSHDLPRKQEHVRVDLSVPDEEDGADVQLEREIYHEANRRVSIHKGNVQRVGSHSDAVQNKICHRENQRAEDADCVKQRDELHNFERGLQAVDNIFLLVGTSFASLVKLQCQSLNLDVRLRVGEVKPHAAESLNRKRYHHRHLEKVAYVIRSVDCRVENRRNEEDNHHAKSTQATVPSREFEEAQADEVSEVGEKFE